MAAYVWLLNSSKTENIIHCRSGLTGFRHAAQLGWRHVAAAPLVLPLRVTPPVVPVWRVVYRGQWTSVKALAALAIMTRNRSKAPVTTHQGRAPSA